jgi:hypothetical protein
MKILNDRNTYRVLNPDMAAAQMVWHTLEKGYEVMFLTSRPKEVEDITNAWLYRIFGEVYDRTLGTHFTLNKTGFLSDKQDIAFVVDDNPEEIVNLNKIGILAFSWEQQWNENIYPKLFVDRENNVWVQDSDADEGQYFWNYIEEK